MELEKKRMAFRVAATLAIVPMVGFLYFRFHPLESQRFALEHSDKFVLYSISRRPVPTSSEAIGQFHGFHILGEKQITYKKVQSLLVKAFYDGLNIPQDYDGSGDCFFPSYGIRATRGNRTVDVALCYACGNVEFYENRATSRQPTTRKPKAIFERAVLNAHLKREEDVQTSE